ncbi:hypothetical protein C8F04DRAFT_602085 [Mycena alexandri]|uniref:F-box domain-containing protein n=1 Tax=Mycena alexandri TaxID=1745969 RepID=A0AAD6SUK6_9AGAR|nr:hypothetical protein C8F04DRAFT_602085 [Mycena alexandri]
MSLYSTWGTILNTFNPENPRHLALHAEMMSHPNAEDTIMVLYYLVSPIRRLPPQVLERIFSFSIVDAQFDLDTSEMPWALTYICSSWRRVAISTPQLWRKIDISFGHWSPSSNLLHLLNLFLQRSSDCPIDVTVQSDVDSDSHPALEMLMAASHRWEDAWLDLPLALFASLGPIKGHLAQLHTLEVLPCVTPDDSDKHLILDAFQIAPKLAEVGIACERNVTVLLPWGQLESYASTTDSLPRLIRSLNGMRNLVICVIKPIYYINEHPSPIQINLPQLSALVIEGGHPCPNGFRGTLLHSFIVPSLEHFKIEWCKDDRYNVSHLINLVRRSGCSLISFSLKMPQKIPDDILEFFEYTPGLERLSLRGTLLTSLLTRKLSRTRSVPGLLCALHTLTIDAEFPSRELVNMVSSRIEP